MTIQQIDSDTFETTFRKRVYTLFRNPCGGWAMWNKPINGRSNPPKIFDTLKQVEEKYKHWAGIALLVGEA